MRAIQRRTRANGLGLCRQSCASLINLANLHGGRPPFSLHVSTSKSVDSGKTHHVGVLEFTAESATDIVVPETVMQQLGLEHGEMVDFEHCILPQGQFVQLQPLSSLFLAIPYDERMSLLTSELAKYVTLTEGSSITVTYGINKYILKVLKCRPEKGMNIVDQDLETDIIEPLDTDPNYQAGNGQCQRVELDRPLASDISVGEYKYYALVNPLGPLPPSMKVEVKMRFGDPDLFLSQDTTTPTAARYTWCAQDLGSVEINLGPENDNWLLHRPLYAGVGALCGDAS